MPNDNVRLTIHAAALLTFIIAVIVLVALDKLQSGDGLTWIVTGTGLITAGLSTTKLIADRRSTTDTQ
ncbi:hypothetical protein [Mycobacteroides abscessus]|uniref:hypothetical protein n=1 Tax=Mycobacteroides abscessus TaxID=36809 RepID=UPI000925A31D|nr:hypothetical protein [Mycobacteroides abscessus]SHS10412.1 Uncharacterised protein [Mycobacteroides abscessus subsp. abscessus]SHS10661.1 Uncharacterised protein [Mycobacteroides abscessus subsp. abscessus]SHS38677.1 Uncharacterised protein [Mycobacteroides abscessus subsp. abscessus]SHS40500.1 Uncharacterised protein [Mycobacteroides abscessus subsp. abscessus]SHT23811.1 Uncharacterised protein [Mycobacteroides abscessus subsp. abscessus]